MNDRFAAFDDARTRFRAEVARWSAELPGLRDAQERLRESLGHLDYVVETPLVYNEALDDVGEDARIRYVLVGDNPGKNEQRADRRRYLVGHSGRLAERIFRELLGADFRSEVLIVNKTPVHTAKTAELKPLLADSGVTGLREVFAESQRFMANLAYDLAEAFDAPIWICGYGELGTKGLFSEWSAALRKRAEGSGIEVWAFPHFSMNRFSIEIPPRFDPRLTPAENLAILGTEARRSRLGW
jgi:hypothetical protein